MMEQFLDKENKLLDEILECQCRLRAAVNERKWNELEDAVYVLGNLADQFEKTENERSKLPSSTMSDELRAKMNDVRSKLIKSQAENKAIGEYVSIMNGFVKEVIDEAIPQGRGKIYGYNGAILQSQPSSVVLNALF